VVPEPNMGRWHGLDVLGGYCNGPARLLDESNQQSYQAKLRKLLAIRRIYGAIVNGRLHGFARVEEARSYNTRRLGTAVPVAFVVTVGHD